MRRGDGVAGVIVDGEIIDGDAVVIAMGPWSILAAAWLPLPAIFGLKGHSLVFEQGPHVPAEAMFCEYREASGAMQTPELFPRADGTTYVCADFERNAAADRPRRGDAGSRRDRAARSNMPGFVAGISLGEDHCAAGLLSTDFERRVAGYRPGARRSGAYVATGHSVWGILNAPATGEAMAELIVDGSARDRRPLAI